MLQLKTPKFTGCLAVHFLLGNGKEGRSKLKENGEPQYFIFILIIFSYNGYTF